MASSLFSPSWYRVAGLRLRLRSHAEIHRQRFRGDLWYVLQDHQTGRFHRLSPSANLLMSLMDGHRSVEEIWDMVGSRSGDDPPTQDETITLLSQLHSSDLLQGELPPDFGELGNRSQKQASRDLWNKLRNPMALRLPLLDPDGFLDATIPFVRPLFTVWGFLLWLALVGTGLTLAVLNWNELTASRADQLFSLQNLAFIAALYPAIKLLHEAGHAYATKAFGGAVHEVGVMLLVFVPAPYVDATSATAFPDKWRRIVVGAAGIMVEVSLASIAMIFWATAEPGLARAAAFNVMLIGGVSTLLFNGNPLLRFDAYYAFADLIEVPNLGVRANKYFWYLAQRHLLGLDSADNPATGKGEGKWLLAYSVLSFIYRIGLSLTIALLIATKLFFIGIALAAVSLGATFLVPLVKGFKFVFTSPRLHDHRARAVSVTLGGVALAIAVLFIIPVPYGTVAQGVVWVPPLAEIRAGSEGIVAELVAQPDSKVAAGDVLISVEDSSIDPRIAVLQAQRTELVARSDAVRFTDKVQAGVLEQQIRQIDGSVDALDKRRDELVIKATSPGRFIVPGAGNLIGRFVKEGDLLGYVVGDETPEVRAVVEQGEVELVRDRTIGVSLRYSTDIEDEVPATIVRSVPAAQYDLPSLALATQGGGPIVLDSHSQQPRSLEGIFIFDIAPASNTQPLLLGSRVYVRFDHGSEPIGWRALRSLRQVFLRTLDA